MMSFLWLFITMTIYIMTKKIYNLKNNILINPLLLTPLLIILLLSFTNTSFARFNSGAHWLTYMLQPSTVAFAIPLYKYFDVLKKYSLEIFTGVFSGVIAAILSSVLFAKWLGLSTSLLESLAPRSITTPFAMIVSKSIGGIPSLTAGFVICTGISGIIIGPLIIRLLSIRHSISKGLLLGMGAHATGTAKAFELGSLEGTAASISMIFAAIITVFIAPYFVPLLLR